MVLCCGLNIAQLQGEIFNLNIKCWLIFNRLFGYVMSSKDSMGAQRLAPLFYYMTYFKIPLSHFVLCFSLRRYAKAQHLGGL